MASSSLLVNLFHDESVGNMNQHDPEKGKYDFNRLEALVMDEGTIGIQLCLVLFISVFTDCDK